MIAIKENDLLKKYFKSIIYVAIVLVTSITCLINRSSYVIFIVLELIIDGVYLFNYYYKKDLHYRRSIYVNAVLIGILIAFLIENKAEFIKYFI